MGRYEAYKDSGVEWIGVIPEGWGTRRFKHILRIVGGSGFPQEAQGRECGDYPFCKVSDINGDGWTVDKAANYVDTEWVKENRISVVPANSILMAKIGAALAKNHRKVNLLDCCIDNNMQALAPDIRHIALKYLYWIMSAVDMSWYDAGGTLPYVDNQRFLNDSCPYPELAHQQAIADYLDAKTAEIDALIADCEREVELLQEYRKTVISEAVTKGLDPAAPMKDSGIDWIGEIPDDWEVVGFKTYLNGIVDYRGRTPEKVDDGVFLITGRNIKQGRIHYELSQEYMRPDDFDTIMSRGRLKVGNVLFTMEAPLGEVALIDRDDCAAAQRIIQLCCNEDELFGAFLAYWIMSDEFQSDLQTYATGSTASGIKASKLGMLRLMHPPMETQHSIVDFLDAKTAEIDSLIEAKQHMADKLREYRRSLISEAVTGKFKVPGVK